MECHGSIESVKIKLNAYQEEQVDAQRKTSTSSASVVRPELQKDSQAADWTMSEKAQAGIDFTSQDSETVRGETCDRVETKVAEAAV